MKKDEQKTNAIRFLEQKKIDFKIHTYSQEEAISGVEVAEVLGQNPDMVFKTLVTAGKSGNHYVFMIPVAKELDLKKAAKAVGEKKRRDDKIERTFTSHGLYSRRLFSRRNEKVFYYNDRRNCEKFPDDNVQRRRDRYADRNKSFRIIQSNLLFDGKPHKRRESAGVIC